MSSASIFLVALALVAISSTTTAVVDADQGRLSAVDKRPFCNAFTGCGKKRSQDPLLPGKLGRRISIAARLLEDGVPPDWRPWPRDETGEDPFSE